MRMIPPAFPSHLIQEAKAEFDHKKAAGLEGEQLVYEQIKDAELPGFAIYSQKLSRHTSKVTGEADFVIFTEAGVFIVEVKAGKKLELRHDGWYDGNKLQKETPWKQAEDNCFTVLEEAKNRYPASQNLLFGWGIALPNVAFKDEHPTVVSRKCIIDQYEIHDTSDANNPMELFLGQLAAHHRERLKIQGESIARGKRPLTKKDFEHLQDIFAREFDLRPSIGSVSKQREGELIQLTPDQTYFIRLMSEDRVRGMVEGGAGTGKTLVAVEVLKKRAEKGEKCALLVQSPGLARHLNAIGSGVFTAFSAEDTSSAAPPYDYVAVDEGQDITTHDGIILLEELTGKNIEESHWGWFMDSNNQTGLHDDIDPDVLEIIKSCCLASKLTENVRNTREVVERVNKTLAMDLGVPQPEASGLQVEYDTWSLETALEKFSTRLTAFFNDERLSPGDLSIVCLGDSLVFIEELREASERAIRKRIRNLNDTDHSNWPPRSHALICTPKQIKGLENKAVLVVAHPDLGLSGVTLEELYVSFTRPTSLLWIMTGNQLKDELRARLKQS